MYGVRRAIISHARPFSLGRTLREGHHFDTLKFVKKLESEGFTAQQSKAVMQALSDVILERYVHHLTEMY